MSARRILAKHGRAGFTLIEVLVAIAIIGILSAIAIPAINTAINTGKTAKVRLEVGALEQAIERYRNQYNDYPPDFSSWAHIERHYKKIFPRIADSELFRLRMLLDVDPSNDTAVTPPATWPAHNPAAMNRAKAIVFTLGGYSDNPLFPFTGPEGPLELISSTATAVVYQVNMDRPKKIYDFDPTRLNVTELSASQPVSPTNRRLSTDGDLFPSYASSEGGAPFVYFDSRTYAYFDPTFGEFNGYGSTEHGFVRPYFSTIQAANVSGANYGTLANALTAWQFMNPDTFQIIAPGSDGKFGSFANLSGSGLEPLYFQYPTGAGIAPSLALSAAIPGSLLVPGIRAYQESAKFGIREDFQPDNVANFSRRRLVDDLAE